MKEELAISKKYLIILFGIMTIIAIVAGVVLSKNYLKHKAAINSLVVTEINGVIKSMKDESRGSYYLEIEMGEERLSIHSLPLAWEVQNYNIEVGDSVSKNANSRVMSFYKLKNGVKEKVCQFQM